MNPENISTAQLLTSCNATAAELLQLISSFSESEINTIPAKDSWTAAQVADHVTQSNNSVAQAMEAAGTPTHRKPDEGAPKLKAIFLNFEKKLQSPEIILPGKGTYQKDILIANLEQSIHRIQQIAAGADLTETVSHSVLGQNTRLEIMYFVWYHTQRHIHQLKNIRQIVTVHPAKA